MDEILLNRLKKQVTSDLSDFLPKGCFKLEQNLSVNGKELSWDEKWEIMATYFGNKLCYESDCNITNLKPKQYSAAKVLNAIGNLTDPEITETQSKKSLHAAIQEYLEYLPEQEIKPFKSLLLIGTESPEEANQIESKFEPHNAVGKLAVKAAIEIERVTGRRAAVEDVMKKLQEWASVGSYPDILIKPGRGNVVWLTGKSEQRAFSIGACEKILEKWNKSRV